MHTLGWLLHVLVEELPRRLDRPVQPLIKLVLFFGVFHPVKYVGQMCWYVDPPKKAKRNNATKNMQKRTYPGDLRAAVPDPLQGEEEEGGGDHEVEPLPSPEGRGGQGRRRVAQAGGALLHVCE